MKRSPMPPRSTPLRPVPSGGGRRKAAKKRKPSEFARIYGSKERVKFVASLPCVAAIHGCVGRIDGHHTENGGKGRKADAHTIVPLCRFHHDTLHDHGVRTFQFVYSVDLKAEAARVAALWDSRSLASARLAEGV